MNQVSDVLTLASQAISQNIDAVLVTVVHTEGSAYRRAGAMMLVCADGRSKGMISGGCLEPYITRRAFWLTRHGATVQVYQTGEDQDNSANDVGDTDIDSDEALQSNINDEFNFGIGCNGRVHVLFERLSTAKPVLKLIQQVRQTLKPIRIATLIRTSVIDIDSETNDIEIDDINNINLNEYPIALRLSLSDSNVDDLLLTETDEQNFTNEPDLDTLASITRLLSDKFNNDCDGTKTTTKTHSSSPAKYITLNTQTKSKEGHEIIQQSGWLVQHIKPQQRLLICGAGDDVIPLVTMAKMQDWHVTVIDSRSQYATRMRFPNADTVQCVAVDDTDTLIKLSRNAAVAVMSHSLSQDRARLNVLLKQDLPYLGQLGPKYRTERLIEEINAMHNDDSELKQIARGVARLYYPIGYKLGGDGPEALALGIMAQINAVIHGKTFEPVKT